MKIGLSWWGLCASFKQHSFIRVDTPDGHRYGRPILIRALQAAGHDVFALQKRREPDLFSGVKYVCETSGQLSTLCVDRTADDKALFPDLDVLFLEWRWKTYKNDRAHPKHDPTKHEPDLDRQLELIEFYKDRCPIIVWDTDLKVTPEDEARWPELVLTDPSLETNRLTRDRVSLPFWTDWEELLPVAEPYPIYGLVGNNYERPGEFQKYFFSVAQDTRLMGVQTSMYGNWLQRSPEREPPEQLISSYRNVAFNHRMNFFDSLSMMNRFLCTTHVSKPRYYETSFISPRYLEALAMGCPALTPGSFRAGGLLGEKYVVRSPVDVIDAVRGAKTWTLADRIDVVSEQRENLRRHGKFGVDSIIDFIVSVAGGSKHA